MKRARQAADTADQNAQITISELKDIKDRLTKLEKSSIKLGKSSIKTNLDLHKTKTSLRSDRILWVPDQLSNLATDILLFWSNEQPKEFAPGTVPLNRFEDMARSKSEYFASLCDGLKVSAEQQEEVGLRFDEVVNRRNVLIHFGTWSVLTKRVAAIQRILEEDPKLSEGFDEEVKIIQAFGVFGPST